MAKSQRVGVLQWLAVATLVTLSIGTAVAAGPSENTTPLGKLDVSLKWFPEDTAFYSVMLRNREQIEAVAKSKAWKSLMAMPAVKEGLAQLDKAMNENEQAAKAKIFLENPAIRKALDTLADMFSQETFVYADKHTVEALELLQHVLRAAQFHGNVGQIASLVSGDESDTPGQAIVFGALADHLHLMKVPTIVLGFKVKDKERAKEELTQLEGLITLAMMANPELAKHTKRVSVGGADFFTLALDGSMIPWDQVPVDELRKNELRQGDVDKVIAKVKKLTLTLGFGMRDDYVLLVISPSAKKLEHLGKGKLLIDRPEFKPLQAMADRRLVAVSYLSEGLSRLGNNSGDIDSLVQMVDKVLPKIPITSGQREQVRKDVDALAVDLKSLFPKPGAAMAFAFLTDRGVEGYSYDWSGHGAVDGTKPLAILNHLGGTPLLAIVGRGKVSMEGYDKVVKWVKVGYRYIDEFVVPKIESDGVNSEQYGKIKELFLPLVQRFDETTRTMFLPALADGQVGLVLDGKLTSKQFHKQQPASDRPLPMAEPAILLGVSDAKLLAKAMKQYREIINAGAKAVAELDPAKPKPFQIPEPKLATSSQGTVGSYPLPKEWGVTEEVSLAFGLSDHVAVIGISTSHVERLLKDNPLTVGGLLADAQRPLAGASLLSWSGILETATPWIEYAAKQVARQQPEKKAQIAAIADQVRTVFRALQSFRTVTAQTYVEGAALVTHTLVEIHDIP